MKPLFRPRDPEPPPEERADLLKAYKGGRKDELRSLSRDAGDNARDEFREAYERGRRDERARHRGSPFAALLVAVIVLAGAGALILAAREGSFARGGAVVDTNLSEAARTVEAPVHKAADSAGDALQGAGQGIKRSAGSERR